MVVLERQIDVRSDLRNGFWWCWEPNGCAERLVNADRMETADDWITCNIVNRISFLKGKKQRILSIYIIIYCREFSLKMSKWIIHKSQEYCMYNIILWWLFWDHYRYIQFSWLYLIWFIRNVYRRDTQICLISNVRYDVMCALYWLVMLADSSFIEQASDFSSYHIVF